MDRKEFLGHLHAADFGGLFLECGWSSPTSKTPIEIAIGETSYAFVEVAQQKGFRVLVCRTPHIPDSSARRALDAKIRKRFDAYLMVFVSADASFRHLWSVPVKSVDRRQLVTVEYDKDDQAMFLLEKMNAVSFSFDESPTIIDVANRVNSAFLVNTTDVTKKFYQAFRKQHDMFVKGIENITGKEEREWYASVMLNRLMFCYFIQKKRFLDFDENYLGNKLKATQAKKGRDKFYESFYRSFLKQLFSDGLDKPIAARSDYFIRKYGRIPYLNGGMFSLHQIERENKDIDIPDKVFERLFAFFDEWHWHLDNRITASGRNINPDVLGYIFEQYINDRAQMGAYYTKEDITEYIGRNCIVPWLWKKAVGDRNINEFPLSDRYIFPAMRKGMEHELPAEIEKGVAVEPQKTLRARRVNWNKPADEKFALPTEIWRETVARRQRCAEIREKFVKGEIRDIHDFITCNLDIRTFVEDVIRDTDDHRLVLHFYKALREVTILDPTCGSGAFLFAALNILEPLYEACLDRMEDFHEKNKNLFKDELEEMGRARAPAASSVGSRVSRDRPPNRQYFIYKNIILRNLYGVDIMHEATEIARLRLFLKMVAVVDVDETDPNLGLDPLPDIDFNIRCGNTLVGYATEQEIKDGLINGDMFAYVELKAKIDTEMQKASMAFDFFRREQLNLMGDRHELVKAKAEIHTRLAEIRKLLDKHLYASAGTLKKREKWLADTQPFHWYTEFYPIMHGRGGFDVIIGNPPYVEYSKKSRITGQAVIDYYRIDGYKTSSTGNLYAFVLERSLRLLKLDSGIGMIVPISAISNPKFSPLMELFSEATIQWVSAYSNRPGKLFEGVEQRLAILVARRKNNPLHEYYSADYQHWYVDEREGLFERFEYRQRFFNGCIGSFCKIGNGVAESIWQKLQQFADVHFGETFEPGCNGGVYYHNAPTYFVRAMPYKPNAGKGMKESSHYKLIPANSNTRVGISCVLNSSLFYWFYKVVSNCRDFSEREISPFPVGSIQYSTLHEIGEKLKKSYQENKEIKNRDYSGSVVFYEEYYPSKSKSIIDEIDELLAKHYGFTEEELDFIINYDIKYRMGDELNAE